MADESGVPVMSEAQGRRRRFLQAGIAAAASTLVPTSARAGPFVPNETQVSSAVDLFDLEYSQSLAMYARTAGRSSPIPTP
jgi:hypothetical protein